MTSGVHLAHNRESRSLIQRVARRELNQAFFSGLYLKPEGGVHGDLQAAFAELVAESGDRVNDRIVDTTNGAESVPQ